MSMAPVTKPWFGESRPLRGALSRPRLSRPRVCSVSHDTRVHRARGCADGAHVETKCTSGCGASSKYGFDMCCATECCAAPTPRGHGQCPEFSPGQFPRVGGIQSCEDVVQFHFVWQADTMDAEVQLWIEGLSLTADYINGKGGLRIGEGKVGYVNMTSTEYHPDPKAAGRDPFIKLYRVPGYCHSDSTALNLDCCGAGQSTIYAPVAPVARDARVAAEPR
eukprot:COSAG06_NODE_1713_length_8629_cov_25.894842_9_plen_221_part_00